MLIDLLEHLVMQFEKKKIFPKKMLYSHNKLGLKKKNTQKVFFFFQNTHLKEIKSLTVAWIDSYRCYSSVKNTFLMYFCTPQSYIATLI